MLAKAIRVYNITKNEDFTNLYGKELLSHSGWANSKIRGLLLCVCEHWLKRPDDVVMRQAPTVRGAVSGQRENTSLCVVLVAATTRIENSRMTQVLHKLYQNIT